MTLTEADKAAAFRAAGFKPFGRQWKRCVEDPSPSYQPGAIQEVLDLNKDGRPEVVVVETSSFCHGGEGEWFAVLSREPSGAWRQVLETGGVFVAMPSAANGWQEIMVGGPGFTHPALRYNGKQYVQHRMVKE
jgi:hypothetical protein